MQSHKKLPHLNAIGHQQFVTFRTYDSLDSYLTKIMNDKSLKENIKQYKIDKILDLSTNGATLNENILQYLYSYFLDLDRSVYNITSFVIMPNHVHILFEQLKPLQDTMRVLKSKSAIKINKMLEKSGKFWASDYYDKIIRDEKHFYQVYEYIQNNCTKANLELDGRYYSKYKS